MASFPDSGLAEPPAARPNQRPRSAETLRGASVPRNYEWRGHAYLARPLPQGTEEEGVFFFFFF